MEALVVILILAAAIQQFWTGHKKDKAGHVKAGRLHMLLSVGIILVGIWYVSRVQ